MLVSLLAGCASTNVPPMGYRGQPFRPEADERAMWSQAEKEEEKLAKTGKLYEDPLLEEYLSGVAARLVPAEIQTAGAPPIRVAVFRDPALNAFAMPNGKVYVHTGLLARVENEAQLAAILGHELTHVTNRHALKFNRDARNKRIGFTVLGAAAAIGAAVAAGSQARQGNYVTAEVLRATSNIFLGLGLQLAFLAAVNGYGRDLEREADAEGGRGRRGACYCIRSEIPSARAAIPRYSCSTSSAMRRFLHHSSGAKVSWRTGWRSPSIRPPDSRAQIILSLRVWSAEPTRISRR